MSDNNTDNGNNGAQPQRGFEAVKNHMLENKIETALWISRILSIFFTIGYILPIFRYKKYKQITLNYRFN
jgi:transmembrane protein 33